jgi:DNA-directed RNA polymerase specialized sigma24 family protein
MAMTGTLTGQGLTAVLALFASDPERAGVRYEAVRVRLIRFFAWQGVLEAEECADETIDRLARRLSEGERIHSSDPARYAQGVARNVLREHRAREARDTQHRSLWPRDALAPPPEAETPRAACLERCLGALAAEDRRLVLEYYQGSGGERIAHRREMAARLGVAVPALRVRMHRLRLRLEACVSACAGTGTETFGPLRAPMSEDDGNDRGRG